MKIGKIFIGIGLVILLIVLVAFASMGFIFLDVMSYTATGSETLNPAGMATGHALVVYDPGVTGFAKDAATKIAVDLQSKGYAVELAGVRSAAAANVSGYDVIVAGGPTYAGNVSSSIKSYLQELKPSSDAKIGAFATGSYVTSGENPVALPEDSPLKIKSSIKLLSSDDADKRCTEFVSALLQ